MTGLGPAAWPPAPIKTERLPDFHAELADPRAVSALYRGMPWELRPEVEDRIRRRARNRKVRGAVRVAAVIAGLAVFVLLA